MAKRRKKRTPAQSLIRGSIPLVLWALFAWWYTNTGGPLSEREIETYLAEAEAQGRDPERLELLRSFLEADTGDDFVMLNLIHMNKTVRGLADLPEPATGADALDRYMSHMWPALIWRACHPVSAGTAAAPALDVWGLTDANDWSQGALMRYRSRRDLMEISSDPLFVEPHDYKIAAMNKTVAVPLDPWTSTGDLRVLLGLVAVIFALLLGRR